MATHCWWSYEYHALVVKSTECKPCTAMGKYLKSGILAKQIQPHLPCFEPNQDIQIDFGGSIFDEKGNEIYFVAAIDRFSRFPAACIYETANGPIVLKNLVMCIENHGISRSIRLDQRKCSVGHQVKTLFNRNNIEIIEDPVNDHREFGLVETRIRLGIDLIVSNRQIIRST